MRFEEEAREGLGATAASSTYPEPPVALGVCLSEISLGLDTRARETMGRDGVKGKRWFGRNFRKMEVALLGNFCEPDGRFTCLQSHLLGAHTLKLVC